MKWLSIAAAMAASVSLAAQTTQPTPVPAPQSPKESARVEQRAQSMREQIGQGRTVQSHVRVMVRLKNGNKLQGVVKDGRLVERVDGLRFVDAHAQDRGAGIRLWYTSGARNYVFVPFADFSEYEVMQRLSAQQIAEIEGEMQMEERRAAERLAAEAQGAKGGASAAPEAGAPAPAPGQEGATSAPKGAAGDDKAKEAESAAQAQQRKWFTLVNTYPPDDGWNKARRDEISRRLVVVGAKPSDLEQAFVTQFAEWEKACNHFGLGSATGVDGGTPPPADAGTEGNGAGATTKSRRRKQ
jgi:hypothetical protein